MATEKLTGCGLSLGEIRPAAGPSDRSGGSPLLSSIRQLCSKAWASSELRSAQESRFTSPRLQRPNGACDRRAHDPHSKDPLSGIRAPASQYRGFRSLENQPSSAGHSRLVSSLARALPAAEQPPAGGWGRRFLSIIASITSFFEDLAGRCHRAGSGCRAGSLGPGSWARSTRRAPPCRSPWAVASSQSGVGLGAAAKKAIATLFVRGQGAKRVAHP